MRTAWSIAADTRNDTSDKALQLLSTLDQYCHASISNEVANRASSNQGKGFYRIIYSSNLLNLHLSRQQSLPSPSQSQTQMQIQETRAHVLEIFRGLEDLSHNHNPATSPLSYSFHYAPLFGFVCQLLGLSLPTTERVFMRILLRDLCSAAARLNIVGPIEATSIQYEHSNMIEDLLMSKTGFTDPSLLEIVPFYDAEVPCQTCFISDYLQSLHDKLYSRLFNS